MNQLVEQKIDFRLVPPVAEKDFLHAATMWYDCSSEDTDIAVIENNMVYYDTTAQETLLWNFNDISTYLYYQDVKEIPFDQNQYPVKIEHIPDRYIDAQAQAFTDASAELELGYCMDLKRYLEFHRMFYMDKYTLDRFNRKEPTYRNAPVKEVW